MEEQTGTMIAPPAASELPKADSKDYQHWRLTGELPAASAVVEESPTSPAEETPKAEGEAPPVAASEPAKTDKVETRSDKTARRFEELLAKNKAQAKELADLKASRVSAEAPPAPAADKTPATTKEPAKDPLAAKIDAIKAEFKAKEGTYSEYADYVVDLNQAISDAKEQHKAEQKVNASSMELWDSKIAEARAVHEDFDTMAIELTKPNVVPHGSVIEQWLFKSPVGAEVMYHLGKNMDDLKRISALDGFDQLWLAIDLIAFF